MTPFALDGELVALKPISKREIAGLQLAVPHGPRYIKEHEGKMAIRWIDGETLFDRQPSNVDLAAAFPDFLLRLAAIHSQGVLHGDISARNCVFTPAKTLTLIDFGRAISEAFPWEQMGNMRFYPMESIVHPRVYDHLSEQYVVGKMFSQLFTGGVAQSMLASIIDPPQSLAPAGVPDHIWECILVMLNTDREKRFPTLSKAARTFF